MAQCLEYTRKIVEKSIPPQDVDDTVQEIMLSLIQIDGLEKKSIKQLRVLIRVIAERRITDYYRNKDDKLLYYGLFFDYILEAIIPEPEIVLSLYEILDQIPYNEELRKRLMGFTYSEIGDSIDRSTNAARYRCMVAYRQARQLLKC